VTAHFGLKDVSVIENWIFCFSTFRNICELYGRDWNRRLIQIKLPTHPTHTSLKNKSIYINKLYATLSCLNYVLKQLSPDSIFSERLKELLKPCPLAQKNGLSSKLARRTIVVITIDYNTNFATDNN
jgi:abortive infection bacteriophage resistance protein